MVIKNPHNHSGLIKPRLFLSYTPSLLQVTRDYANCSYSGTQADKAATILNVVGHCMRGTKENSGEFCTGYSML